MRALSMRASALQEQLVAVQEDHAAAVAALEGMRDALKQQGSELQKQLQASEARCQQLSDTLLNEQERELDMEVKMTALREQSRANERKSEQESSIARGLQQRLERMHDTCVQQRACMQWFLKAARSSKEKGRQTLVEEKQGRLEMSKEAALVIERQQDAHRQQMHDAESRHREEMEEQQQKHAEVQTLVSQLESQLRILEQDLGEQQREADKTRAAHLAALQSRRAEEERVWGLVQDESRRLAEVQTTLTELEEVTARCTAECQRSVSQAGALRAALQQAQRDARAQQQRLGHMQEDKERLAFARDDLQRENSLLANKVKTLEWEASSASSAATMTQKQLQAAQDALARRQVAESQNAQLEAALLRMKEEVRAGSEEVRVLRTSSSLERDQLQQRVLELEAELKAKQEHQGNRDLGIDSQLTGEEACVLTAMATRAAVATVGGMDGTSGKITGRERDFVAEANAEARRMLAESKEAAERAADARRKEQEKWRAESKAAAEWETDVRRKEQERWRAREVEKGREEQRKLHEDRDKDKVLAQALKQADDIRNEAKADAAQILVRAQRDADIERVLARRRARELSADRSGEAARSATPDSVLAVDNHSANSKSVPTTSYYRPEEPRFVTRVRVRGGAGSGRSSRETSPPFENTRYSAERQEIARDAALLHRSLADDLRANAQSSGIEGRAESKLLELLDSTASSERDKQAILTKLLSGNFDDATRQLAQMKNDSKEEHAVNPCSADKKTKKTKKAAEALIAACGGGAHSHSKVLQKAASTATGSRRQAADRPQRSELFSDDIDPLLKAAQDQVADFYQRKQQERLQNEHIIEHMIP